VIDARDLSALVIRVDDFPQDLGTSAMRPLDYRNPGTVAQPDPAVPQKAAA
jgi:hypothetical protein